jgi:hypothetical protein
LWRFLKKESFYLNQASPKFWKGKNLREKFVKIKKTIRQKKSNIWV